MSALGVYICVYPRTCGLPAVHRLQGFYQRKQEPEVRIVFEGSGSEKKEPKALSLLIKKQGRVYPWDKILLSYKKEQNTNTSIDEPQKQHAK